MLERIAYNEDTELILKFKNGDISAFEELLVKYEKPLLNFIFRFIGNHAEAEDLTQEVFLKIFQSAKNYEPKAKFSTWLYKIATYVCIDYQRKYSRKLQPVSLDKPVASDEGNMVRQTPDISETTAETSFERKQINETIQSALLSLPTNQRLVISLKVY